jgi:hypothetical protein
MKKILAGSFAAAILLVGSAAPAQAKPHNDWCHGCGGGWDGGYYNNWNGWYPGQNVNINVCATGPWRYVTVCLG